jgi:hypothetical protein
MSNVTRVEGPGLLACGINFKKRVGLLTVGKPEGGHTIITELQVEQIDRLIGDLQMIRKTLVDVSKGEEKITIVGG